MRAQPAILVVTGASGAGKTTLVRALEARRLPGVACYYFDTIGVPAPDEMARRFGGAAEWQAAATDEWIGRLLRNEDGADVAVLDGQVRPSAVRASFGRHGARLGRVVLVDCNYPERNERLRGPRGQPELATPDMDCFAAYLRGQADALDLPIIFTTHASVDDALSELAGHVTELAARRTDAGA